MGRKRKRDLKKEEAPSVSNDTEMAAANDPARAGGASSPKAKKRPEMEHSEKQTTGALIAAIMGAPVDPSLGVDPKCAAKLRREVKVMHARGVMVDIPWPRDEKLLLALT
jgi:hypothetical protein